MFKINEKHNKEISSILVQFIWCVTVVKLLIELCKIMYVL